MAALDLAVRDAGFSAVDRQRAEGLLVSLGLPIRSPSALDVPDLLRRMTTDKKNRRQMLRFVLPERVGTLRWFDEPEEESIRLAINRIAAC